MLKEVPGLLKVLVGYWVPPEVQPPDRHSCAKRPCQDKDNKTIRKTGLNPPERRGADFREGTHGNPGHKFLSFRTLFEGWAEEKRSVLRVSNLVINPDDLNVLL